MRPDARDALLALALAGTAGGATAGTTWLCGLSEGATRIVCVADVDLLAAAPEAPTAQVRGTRFPLDPGGQWTVDLWSPATDPEAVTHLARATICYRSPGCAVVMALRAPASLRAAR